MSPPRDLDEGVAAVLEQTRAHRAALTRSASFARDSLHRLLRCTRCHRWRLDTRTFAGSLQLAEGGARSCRDLDELLAYLQVQHRALHRQDLLDPCECGAPPLALSLRAARFYHGVSGSGAELVVELRYADESPCAVRVGRATWDGPVAFLADADEAKLRVLLGVPLSTMGVWQAVVASAEGAVAGIEEGLSLAAFSAADVALRAAIDEALASDADLRAYGLTPRVVADPHWHWLAHDPALRARPDTVLVMLLRHDVLVARVAVLAARHGLGTRREGDTVWVDGALGRWPVALAVVAEEGLRHGYTLSTMAAAAVALCQERIETMEGFAEAVRQLRPGVVFEADGMLLTPVLGGRRGRPFDLRVAPFGGVADGETLERDLRFHLHEAPPWADPQGVCPCGAVRWLSERVLYDTDLAAMPGDGAEVLRVGPFGEGATRVWAMECSRHVDYAVAPLLAEVPPAVRARRIDDALDRFERVVRVALHRDAEGRPAALVEGVAVVDAVLHPRWLRGLTAAVLPEEATVGVRALHRDLVLLHHAEVDRTLVERLVAAAPLLHALQRGVALPTWTWHATVDATVEAAGRFVREDG